jgi:predicted ATPase/class 3 adenylate cyclase
MTLFASSRSYSRVVGMAVFLFTDIEGSTRLWADHRAEMPAALARHDELLSDAVRAAGGQVFKHTGDGVAAVFPTVSLAVEAAAAAQQALGAYDWGTIRAIRVRMAVHAGEAEQRDGDWFGPALNRTARLMGIGHGGQVLLSGAAHELMSNDPRPGFSYVDLGAHRLRDLSRAEHVWQLVGDGLERSFPPLRSFDGSRGMLPAQTTSFVGRQPEMEQVGTEVVSSRLVTLVGPGGVGKTRLAAQVGASLVDKFPDGVWMFELAGLNRPDGLEPSMLATLGRSAVAVSDARQDLLEMIRSWRALLILDNCEHLLRSVAELVIDLLAAAPELTVLATSREPLHVPGERVVPVAPLPIADDAVVLFVDRASSLRPSFVAEGDNREAVLRICQHLDGMPLAIELAAARTVAMTPAEIDRRLDQRFRLLSERHREGDRHGSLQRAVDWSYDLLDDEAKPFFCRLSVFSGNFDAEAAHAVCGGDDELATMDMLASLVDKSLVVATPRGARTSYRLLETMRQYGADRLADDETQLLYRHGEYFADLAERAWDGMRGRHSQDWLDLLDDEFDNLRAAWERALLAQNVDQTVRIAGGLFMYNHTRRLPEIYRWVEQALALPDTYRHRMARQARLHWAYARYMNNELPAAEAETRAVLAEGDDADPLKPLALTAVLAGTVRYLGNAEESERLMQEAEECARRRGPDYDYDLAEALWGRCALAQFAGTTDRAAANEYLQLARDLGNARALAGALIQSGMSDPDPRHGQELLAQARELTARTKDTYRHLMATLSIEILADDPEAAIRAIPTVIEQARSTGQRQSVGVLGRTLLGHIATLGRYDAVAVLDGASLPTSIRPALAAEAVGAAREALGEDHYLDLYGKGQSFSPAELEEYLLELASDLS